MFGHLNGFEASLFNDFRRLEREMDHMFDTVPWTGGTRASSRAYPPLNVGLSSDQIDVYLFVPGIDPKKLEITLHQNLLTIKGERQLKREGATQHYRRERFDGDFQRAVNLPEDANPEKVEANYKDGVLHVAVKRCEAVKPRQIEVS